MGAELPLLVSWNGAAGLLEVPVPHLRMWVRWGAWFQTAYDVPQMVEADHWFLKRPFWYTERLVEWAMGHGLIRAYPGPMPVAVPVYSHVEVAERYGLGAHITHRWLLNRALVEQGHAVPAKQVLPEPDVEVEGVVLWYPRTIEVWGRSVGREA